MIRAHFSHRHFSRCALSSIGLIFITFVRCLDELSATYLNFLWKPGKTVKLMRIRHRRNISCCPATVICVLFLVWLTRSHTYTKTLMFWLEWRIWLEWWIRTRYMRFWQMRLIFVIALHTRYTESFWLFIVAVDLAYWETIEPNHTCICRHKVKILNGDFSYVQSTTSRN